MFAKIWEEVLFHVWRLRLFPERSNLASFAAAKVHFLLSDIMGGVAGGPSCCGRKGPEEDKFFDRRVVLPAGLKAPTCRGRPSGVSQER